MPEREIAWLERDVVTAAGPEATMYLQGQLSQDLDGLALGRSTWSWVLSPAGKVDALVRATRLDDDRWAVDTDRDWGEALCARLNRFKLRTKVELELQTWKGAAVLEGDIEKCLDVGRDWHRAAPWPGLSAVDVFGPDLAAQPGTAVVDPARWEAERILAGLPRMGAELTERTIPGETGLMDLTVSFTKGCYTGQELVARIDSRGGHVPRRLVRLAFAGEVEAGAELCTEDGAAAGTVTSVAFAHGWIGLGYVKRGVDAASGLRAGPDRSPVRVEDLGS